MSRPRPGAVAAGSRQALHAWLPVMIGLAVPVVPSLIDLFRCVWSQDEQMHGPSGPLATKSSALPVSRLEMQLNPEHNEPFTYWAMIGDQVVLGSVHRKLVEMKYGLQGQVVDGFLFRVSSIEKSSSSAFDHQAMFVSEMLGASSPVDRRRVSGI